MPRTEKKIYLTFDDGPIPGVTDFVQDVLRKFHAKATFFCVGENLFKYPEQVRSLITEGHQLGNHTYKHLCGTTINDTEYLEDVGRCAQTLSKFIFPTSQKPLMRPPYGRIRRSQVRAIIQSHTIAMWDVLSGDFDTATKPEKHLRKSINATQPGSIVVFHDSLKAQKNLEYILPRYLEYFSEQGFLFETLYV